MDHEPGSSLKGIDLLSLDVLNRDQIDTIVSRAVELREQWQSRSLLPELEGKRIGLITDLPGWRNPVALKLGASEMGAVCAQVPVSLSGGEEIRDLAGYLDNWFDAVAVRTPSLSTLNSFADYLQAPVINLRTHDNHPCEILGDLAYIHSRKGKIAGIKVVVAAPAGNILNSWIELAQILEFELIQFSIPELTSTQSSVSSFETCTDNNCLHDADVIITDCWPDQADAEVIRSLKQLQINGALLDQCKRDVLFVPCPPVTRGQEVSDDAMEHASCCCIEAKEYLLHVQNAVMQLILAD